jgi:hypothetical protein
MSTWGSFVRAGALAGSLVLAASAAEAAGPTKDECLDAHGKGQDAREAGQLAQAGKLFLRCADAACPDLVRNDCARFADEIDRLQPTVTFAARDGAQRDLPDTAVYVDGALVAAHLGDGKAHDVDPGRHEVRFVHAGKETVLEVVVSQGEKARALVGTFTVAPAPAPAMALEPHPETPSRARPAGPLIPLGLGAAAALAGGALIAVGLAKLPAGCSLATHECAAPPGDATFARAGSAVNLVNTGGIAGGAGLLVLGGSLAWYLAAPSRPARTGARLSPWIGRDGAGLALTGSL